MKPIYFLPIILLAAGAGAHGAATHRWAVVAPTGRADAVHAHTLAIGDFRAEEIPNEIPLKEKSHGTTKRYDSPSRHHWVMVSVTSGPPGAVATHTPDVCYPASGYRTMKDPVRKEIDLPSGGRASYYEAEFEKKSATGIDRQRVRWAWSADGQFTAPDRPRFAYLRVPELYKVYIVTPVLEATGTGDEAVVTGFVAAAFVQYGGVIAGR